MTRDIHILRAQSGLRTTIGALLDDYPKAVKDGRTDAWLKAIMAVAEWYAHIEEHGVDGLRVTTSPVSMPSSLCVGATPAENNLTN